MQHRLQIKHKKAPPAAPAWSRKVRLFSCLLYRQLLNTKARLPTEIMSGKRVLLPPDTTQSSAPLVHVQRSCLRMCGPPISAVRQAVSLVTGYENRISKPLRVACPRGPMSSLSIQNAAVALFGGSVQQRRSCCFKRIAGSIT
jgi:hypothetical protein